MYGRWLLILTILINFGGCSPALAGMDTLGDYSRIKADEKLRVKEEENSTKNFLQALERYHLKHGNLNAAHRVAEMAKKH